MNITSLSTLYRSINIIPSCLKTMLMLAFTAGIAVSARAQGVGQQATGSVSGSGSGPYDFVLSFSDVASATAPIGSVWYAWKPGFFYLPSAPTTVSAPAGWTATIFNSGSMSSIQYVASSSADYITAGQSLSGFGYTATFSPAQLAAAPNSGVSVAYSGVLFSDSGQTFTVAAVPEPSTLALLMLGATGSWLIGRRKLSAA